MTRKHLWLSLVCLLSITVSMACATGHYHTVATYSFDPAIDAAVPDDPVGQLVDGIWAPGGALYDCAEAVGWFTGSPDTEYVTIWFDMGAVIPLSRMTFGYWSSTNNLICGPYNISVAFSDLASPDTSDPFATTGWADEIIDSGFSASDWAQVHFTPTTDIRAAGSARWARVRMRIQNAWYGARHASFDEFQFSDPNFVEIDQDPSGQSVAAGETATFSVQAYCTTELSYRWKKDGVELYDDGRITDANTPSLQIANTSPLDDGDYSCMITAVSDPTGVESATAPLSVVGGYPVYTASLPPDVAVPDDPPGQLVDGVWAPAGTTWTADEAVGWWQNGTVALWFNMGQVKELSKIRLGYWCHTYGQGTAETMVTRPWPMTVDFSSLDNPNITDPDNSTDWSSTITDQTFEESYWSEAHFRHVTDIAGNSAKWVRLKIRPQNVEYGNRWLVMDEIQILDPNEAAGLINITAQPASQTVNVGQTAVFSVTATGTGINYQWQKDGVDIPGATDATLTLTDVQRDDSGTTYTCLLWNELDSYATAPATLTVNCWFAIVGDFNGDCTEDLLDLATFAENWLKDSTQAP